MAREHARLATKIRLKLSSCPHIYFIKQLMDAFVKPRENNLNQETSSLLIRRLKNYTGFSRQQFTQKQELNFGLHRQQSENRLKEKSSRLAQMSERRTEQRTQERKRLVHSLCGYGKGHRRKKKIRIKSRSPRQQQHGDPHKDLHTEPKNLGRHLLTADLQERKSFACCTTKTNAGHLTRRSEQAETKTERSW
jgi:hypothetical protein